MAITIIQPRPTPQFIHRDGGASSDSDSDTGGGVDLEGDISMTMGRPSKRAKYGDDIVTPGEVITDDTQYMRYVTFPIHPPPWEAHFCIIHRCLSLFLQATSH